VPREALGGDGALRAKARGVTAPKKASKEGDRGLPGRVACHKLEEELARIAIADHRAAGVGGGLEKARREGMRTRSAVAYSMLPARTVRPGLASKEVDVGHSRGSGEEQGGRG
jgi:hypothetical protein